MGVNIRVKSRGKFKDIDVDIEELTAGDVVGMSGSTDQNEDDFMWSVMALCITKNGKRIFKDTDDVKKRLSAQSFSKAMDLVNSVNGLSETEDARKN